MWLPEEAECGQVAHRPSLDGRAVALRRTTWSEHGMASVNQTRQHCVNQMGKTHSKPLAAWHGRGTAWARHAMCESALILQKLALSKRMIEVPDHVYVFYGYRVIFCRQGHIYDPVLLSQDRNYTCFLLLTLRLLMSYIYMEHLFLMFLDHTQLRTTVGRTPLDV